MPVRYRRPPGARGSDSDAAQPGSEGRSMIWVVASVVVVSVLVVMAVMASSGTAEGPTGSDGDSQGRRMSEEVAQNLPPGTRHPEYLERSEDGDLSVAPPSRWRLMNRYHHDSASFTQGLEFHHGHLWESTGLYGHSKLRKVAFATGKAEKSLPLPNSAHFGEGITVVDDAYIPWITWKAGIGYNYTFPDFTLQNTFEYQTHNGQGWGICDDGSRLIVSDGTNYLSYWDRVTFQKTGEVKVTDPHNHIGNGALGAVTRINELECVEGEVLANIWFKDYIVRIDPDSGHVIGKIDFSSLYPHATRPRSADVLNGIAYDPAGSSVEDGYRRLFITGKKWPYMFEVLWYP